MMLPIQPLSVIHFSSRTKKLRQIPDQHPEQTKRRKTPKYKAWVNSPEATAYKTASFSELQVRLKQLNLNPLTLLERSCQKKHIIGAGGKRVLFRIPIRGMEGYAVRAEGVYTNPMKLNGIVKNDSALENDANVGITLATIYGKKQTTHSGVEETKYPSFDIVRRLPNRDMHTSIFGNRLLAPRQNRSKQFSRLITKIANVPIHHYRKLVRQCFTLFTEGKTFDPIPSNFILLPDQSIGIFDFMPIDGNTTRRTGLVAFTNMFDGYDDLPLYDTRMGEKSCITVPAHSKTRIKQKMHQAICDVEAEERLKRLNAN